MMRVHITEKPFRPYAHISRLTRNRADFTALATFVGHCREERGAVQALNPQHYPGFTERQITDFAVRVSDRHGLLAGVIVHRVGHIAAGEPIVLVAALASHRAAAFSAVEELMDYLKTDAPLWKQEHTVDGARWVDPTDEDRRRAAKGRS